MSQKSFKLPPFSFGCGSFILVILCMLSFLWLSVDRYQHALSDFTELKGSSSGGVFTITGCDVWVEHRIRMLEEEYGIAKVIEEDYQPHQGSKFWEYQTYDDVKIIRKIVFLK